MVLDRAKFDSFTIQKDDPSVYDFPSLEFLGDHTQSVIVDNPKVSYFISTYNRGAQLCRTLITLSNQTFKEFEVLIVDDGSTQDLSWINQFKTVLDVHLFRVPRDSWRSCPSRAYKFLYDKARADIIALGHPEMMLANQAMFYLYHGHDAIQRDDCFYYKCGAEDVPNTLPGTSFWVSLKPGFLPQASGMNTLNSIDWKQDAKNIEYLKDYDKFGGFAGRENSWHKSKKGYPWWFVASFNKDCGILEAMPVFDGHGIIDMWFMQYRTIHNMIDVTPNQVLCYHQEHATSAISPNDEYNKYHKGTTHN